MSNKFAEYKQLNLPEINREILDFWKKDKTFEKSISTRANGRSFIFYEGPPSANGMPGIHHVMARTIKDIFCRYKTLCGYKVNRKAGWDTHGLPVELGVEQKLNITKEDIGSKISIEEYNDTCRTEVMKFTGAWEELTEKMGYWVDMDNPYITCDNRYIESLWWLLSELYKKGYLYKGYTIQPYSPAAGTGLSTHELNQPGCYRNVKDTSCVAMFNVIRNNKSEFLFSDTDTPLYILAWTTTPWTLPSNTALAAGADITYLKIKTLNPYTGAPATVIIAEDRAGAYFQEKDNNLSFDTFKPGDKHLPYQHLGKLKGKQLDGIQYHQLIEWIKPEPGGFKVVMGDFVTTEDGTGIVHIAPTFGADDYRMAKQYNIPLLVVEDLHNNRSPLVDKKGRFFVLEEMNPAFRSQSVNTALYQPFSGRYVKNEYDSKTSTDSPSVDVDIAVMLKKENKAFRIEKYEHSYPHCWRTDKPVLYYPLDSWFIKTTAAKDQLIQLNNSINWKPESTGSGRFGKWLENLLDWNLSRSRYWGTPLPIWVTEDRDEEICIGSLAQLKNEIERSVKAGFMKSNPLNDFKPDDFSDKNYLLLDLHRPFVDQIILCSTKGKKMFREPDLIDVWFDSGAMPYAQVHYPFENKDAFPDLFPADFIAEGVDQTRGWFFTLHTIAGVLFNSVAFKNIISNGLVLDKNGNKMSKRLGNAVDPFEIIKKYGSDPMRWYMITNAAPWDNLKFDVEGIEEVNRKFFGTLYNTYSFFALYANIDNYTGEEQEIPITERPEIDRWIISLLNSLIIEVTSHYDNYEPMKAGRCIQDFVMDNLSNWYVRLNRKRFWGGKMGHDKLAAYQTLYSCLETVAILGSPIAPFYCEKLFGDLNRVTGKHQVSSVHLATFPVAVNSAIDKNLEDRMDIAQKASSMILSLRRKVNIKVRQPLQKIMVPVSSALFKENFEQVKNLILSEVNVKEVQYIDDTSGILIKKIKPDFKKLGPRFGKQMKEVAACITKFSQQEILQLEKNNHFELFLSGEKAIITTADVEIISEDIPGWLVANEGSITIALDIQVTDALKQEGIARELINRIQNLRKEKDFDVTDKINIEVQRAEWIEEAIKKHMEYIGSQTLAKSIRLVDSINENNSTFVEINELPIGLRIEKA